MRRFSMLVIVAMVAAVVGVGVNALPASANVSNTYTVGATGDSASSVNDCVTATNTDCTLRDAIDAANADGSGSTDTIVFSSGVTSPITVTSSLSISDSGTLLIDGPGANLLAVSGGASSTNFSVLTIENGADPATISGLTIENGNTGGFGGGIYNSAGTLNVTDSTLSGNAAGVGGGIYNSAGTLNVTDTTLSDNNATFGGGLYNTYSTSVNVTDSTVSDNTADYGGGIYNFNTVNVTDSTVSDNTAYYSGGGIDNQGTVNLAATIIANSGSGRDCYGFGGTDTGYNIDDDGSCGFSGTGSISDSGSLDLGSLSYNGGPTETILPGADSSAVGIIPDNTSVMVDGNSLDLCPITDQRAVPSPSGGSCNAGSVQDASPALDISAPASQSIPYGTSPNLTPSYSAFILSEDPSSLGAPATCYVSQEGNPSDPVMTNPIPPGRYSIYCSGASNSTADTQSDPDTSYAFSYTPGSLEVLEPTVPTNVKLPTISGTLTSGVEVVRIPGSWVGPKPFTFKFQWETCKGPSSADKCKAVKGATNPHGYTLTDADVGRYITVMVTATDSTGGKGYATAVPVGPVTKRDLKG
jgi:hypothetical protein